MRLGLRFILFVGTCFLLLGSAKAGTDTIRVSSLNHRASQLFLSDPDSSLLLATEALRLSEESNYYRGLGLSHLQLSNAQWVFGNFEPSFAHAFKALEVFDSLHDRSQQFEVYINLGRSYLDRGDLNDAEVYYNKALQITEETGSTVFSATIYRNLGIFHTSKGNYAKALAYSLDALKIAQQLAYKVDEAIIYSHIGVIHSIEKNYAVAQDYFTKSLGLAKETGNKRLEAVCYGRLSKLYLELNQPRLALEYGENALQLALSLQAKEPIILALECLVNGYSQIKDYKMALTYSYKLQQYKDSVYSVEKERIVANIYQSHQVEGQQREIKLLSRENELKEQKARNQNLYIISLLGGMLLALTLATLLYKNAIKSKESNKALMLKNKEVEESKNEISRQAASLSSLNQVKDKLFSIIGHDLKGPIGNLQTLLNLFNNKDISQEDFNMLTKSLKRNLDTTRITLDNLLNWSLSQMDGIKTNPQRVMLKTCIEESCALFANDAEHKKIEIDIKIGYDIEVFADLAQLNLVARNLISNAIKFTPQKGKVIIEAKASNGVVNIRVSDTGIGMDAEQVSRILQPGTHQSQLGTENEKGTGLGLMLCKDFVERNGGKLCVSSKPNMGSTFYFNLPTA